MIRGSGSRLPHAAVAVALLLVEVAIARYAPAGSFIRASLGDVLVIALIHCVLRALFTVPVGMAAAASLAFGACAEALQFMHLAQRLGLAEGSILRVLIGDTASVSDLLMYAVGALLAYVVDRGLTAPSTAQRRA